MVSKRYISRSRWQANWFALFLASLIAFFANAGSARSDASLIPVVAAENFYGDVAQLLGGSHVKVSSILSNPDQDPHLFEASPSTARAIAAAKIIILNGANYDPWMSKLIAAHTAFHSNILSIADLIHKTSGSNPHFWYDPETITVLAKALVNDFITIDPNNKSDYDHNLQVFLASLQPLTVKIANMRARYHTTPIAATEPVFGYMAEALGLTMKHERFQLAIMNDTEPSATNIASFETDLKMHGVKLLIYNNQASSPVAEKLVKLAKANAIPIVGVSETAPKNINYVDWMMSQLESVDKALAQKS